MAVRVLVRSLLRARPTISRPAAVGRWDRQRRAASDEAASSLEQLEPEPRESSVVQDNATSRVHDDPYFGIASSSFSQKIVDTLLSPVNTEDIEIKPDGLIYLPEIKYRRILNSSFGPGGWALMPRGETLHFQNESEGAQLITREYALYANGRFVAQAVGEHTFYSRSNLSYGRASESAKSNAVMRCCKDLGVASELWDPQFISKWKREFATDVWCENVRTKDKKKLWRRKGEGSPFPYPWREQKTG